MVNGWLQGLRLPFIALVCCVASGCVSFTQVDEDGRILVHHIGYSQIASRPLQTVPISLEEVAIVGVSTKRGLMLGYRDQRAMRVHMDCRALVVLTADQQVPQVRAILGNTGRDGLCIANVGERNATEKPAPAITHNFGYAVFTKAPTFPSDTNTIALTDQVYGVSLGESGMLGYRQRQRILADEACYGLVLVENSWQFTQLKDAIEQLQGAGICLAMQK